MRTTHTYSCSVHDAGADPEFFFFFLGGGGGGGEGDPGLALCE